ncbi:MAG: molecular chaperone DjiA [Deltaproteobacteria bacterium]|nr:MAG: molecular chaperone DjiA [Deltaproteobacteria bacterium]
MRITSWMGKLVGAVVGGALYGLVGLAIGLFAGALLDYWIARETEDPEEVLKDREYRPRSAREIDEEAQLAFARHLVQLFAATAQADGSVRREEVAVIREFFEQRLHFTGPRLDEVRRMLKQALRTEVDLEGAAKAYAAASEPADRLLFLQALYELGLGDGDINTSQQRTINEIARHLGISEQDHRMVRQLFFTEPGLEEDYRLLGLSPDAEDAAVKKAYRALAARHHPDKVLHLGEEAVAMAQQRFAELQAAYDRIKSARGL